MTNPTGIKFTAFHDYQRSGRPMFLIDGLVIKSSTLISGPPTAGKTILATWIASALIAGQEGSAHGAEGAPGSFIGRRVNVSRQVIAWWGGDPDWLDDLHRSWLLDGDHLASGEVVPVTDGMAYYRDRDQAQERLTWLGHRLVAQGVTVLVIDGLYSLLGEIDINSARDVVPILRGLTQIIDMGIAVMVTATHDPDDGNQLLGSPYVDTWARQMIHIGVGEGDQRRLSILGNMCPAATIEVNLSPGVCEERS